MAKKAMILKQQRKQKYKTREYNRCKICGRPHAYIENMVYAEYVSGNWHTKVRYPA